MEPKTVITALMLQSEAILKQLVAFFDYRSVLLELGCSWGEWLLCKFDEACHSKSLIFRVHKNYTDIPWYSDMLLQHSSGLYIFYSQRYSGLASSSSPFFIDIWCHVYNKLKHNNIEAIFFPCSLIIKNLRATPWIIELQMRQNVAH